MGINDLPTKSEFYNSTCYSRKFISGLQQVSEKAEESDYEEPGCLPYRLQLLMHLVSMVFPVVLIVVRGIISSRRSYCCPRYNKY